MKLDHPHIINESGRSYRIGELDGTQVVYSFERMLMYLEAKGKLMFGDGFKIYEEDRDILLVLCNYIIRHRPQQGIAVVRTCGLWQDQPDAVVEMPGAPSKALYRHTQSQCGLWFQPYRL